MPNWLLLAGVVTAVVAGTLAGVYGLIIVAGLAGLLVVIGYVALLFRFPERGLWLLAMVLPYERIGAIPLGFFTLKLGHLISGFTIASWTARSIITKRFRLVYDPLRLPLLLLLTASVLSLINATDPLRGTFLIVQLLIGYLVYTLVVNFLSRRNLKGTLVALWAGSILVAVFGLYQFVGDFLGLPVSLTGLVGQYSGAANFGFARIQSTSLEPLYFANYLLLPLLTALGYLFGTTGRRRLLLIPFLLLIAVVFVLTLARGAFLALAVATIILMLSYRREIFTPRVIAVTVTSLVVASVAVVFLLVNSSRGKNPLDVFAKQIGVTGKDVSSQERLGSITAAQQLFSEHPLIGVGIGNFGQYYQDPHKKSTDTEHTTQVVNNQPLETLVETGTFGFLALLSLAVVLVERTLRALRTVAGNQILRAALLGSATAALAIGIQAQTFSALYLIHVWFAIGLLVGVQNLILLPKPEQPK